MLWEAPGRHKGLAAVPIKRDGRDACLTSATKLRVLLRLLPCGQRKPRAAASVSGCWGLLCLSCAF